MRLILEILRYIWFKASFKDTIWNVHLSSAWNECFPSAWWQNWDISQNKKTTQFEKYFDSNPLPELKRNLTAITISGHCLSIKYLRKNTIERDKTYCNLYDHYSDVIMGAMASQITSLTIVYSTVYWSAYHRKYQSPALPAFVRGIHRWPVNSPHKWPVTRKMFPRDDIIMWEWCWYWTTCYGRL